jgi:outer membrane protein assembly factor BamA
VAPQQPEATESEPDSSLTSARVDFRSYVFSEAFDEGKEDEPYEHVNPFAPQDNVTEDGDLKEKKYKLSFSPDIIYGTAGYDALYGGVQGVTQMMFSDVLGNHQIAAATNLLIDLRNSDYFLAYSYLPRRIDWTASFFHSARILPFYTARTYFRYRYYGGGMSISYPLDKFRRVDATMSLLSVTQTDIGDPRNPSSNRTFMYPSATYTKDVTVPGFLSPTSGYRFALSLSGSPGGFTSDALQFATILGDFRWYAGLSRGYTFAVRSSGAASIGRDQQLFYTSGVANWINRTFDDFNGFPITDITDFVFATPVMPIRGAEINSQNGSYFGLVNAEFRFPIFAALLPGPLPLVPLYNLQGVTFVDAGSVFGGRSENSFNLWRRRAEDGKRVFDDLSMGTGFGLRTILLGYPVRLDWAWPFDGREFHRRRVYFSIGLDF